MTTLEILELGRERIARGLAKGALARDRLGVKCDPMSRRACCWCAVGATHVTKSFAKLEKAQDVLRSCLPSPYTSLVLFSDTPGRTPGEVYDLYSRAIEAERAKEAQP